MLRVRIPCAALIKIKTGEVMVKREEHLRHKERLRAWMLGRDFYDAVRAFEFAAEQHTGLRKDGVTPEFHHQVSIAHYVRTLSNLRDVQSTLMSVYLHDTLEDKNVEADYIRTQFGDVVCTAVLLLSKKFPGYKKSAEEYYSAMVDNPIASIVKGADRIHNFQTMPAVFTCEKQLKYIEECETYILPMLAKARNRFPDQELAYENIKHALKGQIELIKLMIEARQYASKGQIDLIKWKVEARKASLPEGSK